MSEQVKRYDARYGDDDMFLSEHGEYIHYSDYITLQAERDASREQVKLLQSAKNSYQSGFDAIPTSMVKVFSDWNNRLEQLRKKENASNGI